MHLMSESRAGIPPASEWRHFNQQATLADLFQIDGEGRTPRQACSLEDIQRVFGQPFDPRLVDQLGLEAPWYFCSPQEFLPMVFASTGQTEPGFFPLSAATHLMEIRRSSQQGMTIEGLRIAAVERTTGMPVSILYSQKFPVGIFINVITPRFHISSLNVSMTEEELSPMNESICHELPINPYLLQYGAVPAITRAMLDKSRRVSVSGKYRAFSIETEVDPERNLRIGSRLKSVGHLENVFTLETPDEVTVAHIGENDQDRWQIAFPRHLVPAV